MENLNQPQRLAQTKSAPPAAAAKSGAAKPKGSVFERALDAFLNLISSVPFGIILLVLLLSASMVGMLIQQQELDTFEQYYNSLTPAEKLVYGRLGFFNIYHVWYFNLMLLVLSLNIILASIDYFPKAWRNMRHKKLTASPRFTQTLRVKHDPLELPQFKQDELTRRAIAAARAFGYKAIATEKEGRTTVFAEKGAWNRMGAYVVHIALLTIFAGGFLTSTRSHSGGMWVQPGQTTDRIMQNTFDVDNATNQYAVGQRALALPFEVECLDLQQKLIDKNKYIDGGNTIDWLTRVRIRDKQTGQVEDALVHLNKPYDYRGYRMFQASFRELGSARTVNLQVTPEAGGTPQSIALKLNEEARLADGTTVRYVEFNPDFTVNQQGEAGIASGEYNNPAAHLEVVKPDGARTPVWAFNEKLAKQIEAAPFLKARLSAEGGPKFLLTDFEKVSQAHMLQINYDPGKLPFYFGSFLLCATLIAIFFFSHQRLWMVVEDGRVSLGGDANRNRLGLEDRIKKIAARIRGESPQAE